MRERDKTMRRFTRFASALNLVDNLYSELSGEEYAPFTRLPDSTIEMVKRVVAAFAIEPPKTEPTVEVLTFDWKNTNKVNPYSFAPLLGISLEHEIINQAIRVLCNKAHDLLSVPRLDDSQVRAVLRLVGNEVAIAYRD